MNVIVITLVDNVLYHFRFNSGPEVSSVFACLISSVNGSTEHDFVFAQFFFEVCGVCVKDFYGNTKTVFFLYFVSTKSIPRNDHELYIR